MSEVDDWHQSRCGKLIQSRTKRARKVNFQKENFTSGFVKYYNEVHLPEKVEGLYPRHRAPPSMCIASVIGFCNMSTKSSENWSNTSSVPIDR